MIFLCFPREVFIGGWGLQSYQMSDPSSLLGPQWNWCVWLSSLPRGGITLEWCWLLLGCLHTARLVILLLMVSSQECIGGSRSAECKGRIHVSIKVRAGLLQDRTCSCLGKLLGCQVGMEGMASQNCVWTRHTVCKLVLEY